ncbi:hypothetical protein [Hyphococcus sp.]|uniref:hypothetical protein n=1 Tax=Hyphococcus sp. TaxID=2038636 RepID=UPI003CCC1951
MCITPESEFFWIGLALFIAVGFVCLRVARRFWRDAAQASDARGWTEAFADHGPALFQCGTWLFILCLAASVCGFGF